MSQIPVSTAAEKRAAHVKAMETEIKSLLQRGFDETHARVQHVHDRLALLTKSQGRRERAINE